MLCLPDHIPAVSPSVLHAPRLAPRARLHRVLARKAFEKVVQTTALAPDEDFFTPKRKNDVKALIKK